jgi:hypothetical protein
VEPTAVTAYFFHASAWVGRAVTADESVINVLEHRDQNDEGGSRDRFEVALKELVVVLDPKELKFRATGRRVTVADLPKASGRAARTVSLSMGKLLMVG